MKKINYLQPILLLVLAVTSAAAAQAQATGQFTLTLKAKHGDQNPPPIHATDLSVTVDRKHAQVTGISPVGATPVELLIAIDDGLRGSFNNQFNDLRNFLGQLPPNVLVGLGYMQHGVVTMATHGFTANHEEAIRAIRTPTGISGINGSPYFVISDVCQHWPSQAADHRRELLVITDGVDRYTGIRYDPENPYFQTAVQDARKAGVLVDSIYFPAQGMPGFIGFNSGQNYLQELAYETGGFFFNEGMGTPVSISNYLKDLGHRLANQYQVEVTVPGVNRSEEAALKVKLENKDVDASFSDVIELERAAK